MTPPAPYAAKAIDALRQMVSAPAGATFMLSNEDCAALVEHFAAAMSLRQEYRVHGHISAETLLAFDAAAGEVIKGALR